jgi:hypothetical protein
MTDRLRYRAMLKDLGMKNKDVAAITTLTDEAIRRSTSKRGNFPKHFLLALEVYDRMKKVIT